LAVVVIIIIILIRVLISISVVDCLLHEQQLLILAHKVTHHPKSVPELFVDYLNRNESLHTQNIRTKNDIHLPWVNTGQELKCLKYKIPKLWNELPTELKE